MFKELAPDTLTVGKDIYRISEFLGRGQYGFVFKYESITTSAPIALKIIRRYTPSDLTELKIMVRARNENWPYILPAWTSMRSIELGSDEEYIHGIAYTMPYAQYGSLLDSINVNDDASGGYWGLDPFTRLMGLLDMTIGLGTLHQAGYQHNDLKPENVLLYSLDDRNIDNFVLPVSLPEWRKIGRTIGIASALFLNADFGRAGAAKEFGRSGKLGTIAFFAPEIVNGSGLTIKTDIWSLGMCFYTLITGYPLVFKVAEAGRLVANYSNQKIQRAIENILSGMKYNQLFDPKTNEQGETFQRAVRNYLITLDIDEDIAEITTKVEEISEEAKMLIRSMLSYYPEERPSIKEIATTIIKDILFKIALTNTGVIQEQRYKMLEEALIYVDSNFN